MTIYSNAPFKYLPKNPVLFIYRAKDASRSPMSIHRVLHGRRDIRTTTDKFGRVIHKIYEYPGIPHRDIIPMVIAVKKMDAAFVEENFGRLGVPYLKVHPKTISKFGEWNNRKLP